MKMKRRNIIIIFSICVLILVILILLLKRIETSQQGEEEYQSSFEKLAQEEYKEKKIVPQNFTPLLREYGGEVEIQEWYSHIYKFVDYYIPSICSSKSISDYYNEKYLEIKKDLGIDSYDKFMLLANQVNKLSDSAKFKDSEFDVTTIESTKDFLSVDFNIFFTNDEKLNLKFIVYNEIKEDVSVSILSK